MAVLLARRSDYQIGAPWAGCFRARLNDAASVCVEFLFFIKPPCRSMAEINGAQIH
jgi:hypothetical protein